MANRGVIIGKFMPPHMGHCYLVDFARHFVDELWILVCSLPHEPIPGTLRYQWMKDLFPDARVVHIEEVNPAANRHQSGAQSIWARAVRDRMDGTPDYVFASEDYGWSFAKELDATFIPVDPSRDQFPISGTELRLKPFRHWHHIPKVVRPWFVRTICINIDEERMRRLARVLQTLYVPRYKDFFEKFSNHAHETSIELLARAQLAQFQALKAQARHFLLCFRSPLTETLADLVLDCSPEETPESIQQRIVAAWPDQF